MVDEAARIRRKVGVDYLLNKERKVAAPKFRAIDGDDDKSDRSCCEPLKQAELDGIISLTDGGLVLCDYDTVLADISFCPFCGSRWRIVSG